MILISDHAALQPSNARLYNLVQVPSLLAVTPASKPLSESRPGPLQECLEQDDNLKRTYLLSLCFRASFFTTQEGFGQSYSDVKSVYVK
jgi:hypothetical protein